MTLNASFTRYNLGNFMVEPFLDALPVALRGIVVAHYSKNGFGPSGYGFLFDFNSNYGAI